MSYFPLRPHPTIGRIRSHGSSGEAFHFRRSALWASTLLLTGCRRDGAPRVEITAHPAPLSALDSPDAALAANKRAVFDMWRSIVNAGHVEVADDLLTEGYVQHSPVLRTGRKAFKEIFSVVPRREIPRWWSRLSSRWSRKAIVS